jgi:putative DNA primase/helicase
MTAETASAFAVLGVEDLDVPDLPEVTEPAPEPMKDAAAAAEASSLFVSVGRFTMTPVGLMARVGKGRNRDAQDEPVWVSASFEIIGRARDVSGHGWAKWLRWHDPDGRKHEYAVPDGALHGDPGALASELASRGLAVARGARNLLAEYLCEADVAQRVTTVSRTGWHTIGDARVFVLPYEVIGSPPTETVVLTGAAAAPYANCGTLEDWTEGVGRLVSGHGRLMLAVSTAFAGPLLNVIEGEGGGINLYGQSSKGKTTVLKAAASVWGRGAADPGFVRSWRATANAQEGVAALVTDTLLCLDEIGVAEGRDAGFAVYQLATGVGKGRSARDGSLRAPTT